MSEYKAFEDVKIDEKKSCESLKILSGNFLETVDEEILYVNDKIKIEEKEEEIREKIKEEPKDFKKEIKIEKDPFDEPPKKLKDQISLPLTSIEPLTFYETFIISKDHTNLRSPFPIIPKIESIDEIGSSSILVEEMDDGNILIFMTQQIFENNERTVMENLSVIRRDLTLVSEKRIKRTCSDNKFKSKEQSLHIIAADNNLTLIKTSSTDDGKVEQTKGTLNWTKSGDFLSRGANAMMLRKLVVEKFVGSVETYFCDIEGVFGISKQIFREPENAKVFDKCMMVQRVDQILILDCGEISKISCFYSSETGRMLKQIWSDNSCQVHINPLSDLPPKNFIKNLHENWEEDLELLSMYLEFKAKRKEELREKFSTPCVKSALKNYIESLIKCKPKNIMNFTMEFMKKLEQSDNVQILKTFERRISKINL